MVPGSTLDRFRKKYKLADLQVNRDAQSVRAREWADESYVTTRKPVRIPRVALRNPPRVSDVLMVDGDSLFNRTTDEQRHLLRVAGLVVPPDWSAGLDAWVTHRLAELAPYVSVPNWRPTLQNWYI